MTSHKKIVIIDDNHFWLQFVSRQLEKMGYSVHAHTSAIEAIDHIDSSTSAVVIDLLLGYNTAIPILHELQSDGEVADIPIIVCSSAASAIPEGSLSSYGVKVILDKTSMRPAEVALAVERVLQ